MGAEGALRLDMDQGGRGGEKAGVGIHAETRGRGGGGDERLPTRVAPCLTRGQADFRPVRPPLLAEYDSTRRRRPQ